MEEINSSGIEPCDSAVEKLEVLCMGNSRPKFTYIEEDDSCGQIFCEVKWGELTAKECGDSKDSAKEAAARSMLKMMTLNKLGAVNGAAAEAFSGNPVSRLQEFLQKKKLPLPDYAEADSRGLSNCSTFVFECRVGALSERGDASTKKEAKKKSAALMLHRLNTEGIAGIGACADTPKASSLSQLESVLKRELRAGIPETILLLRAPLNSASEDVVDRLQRICADYNFKLEYKLKKWKDVEEQCHWRAQLLFTGPAQVFFLGEGNQEEEARQHAARSLLAFFQDLVNES